MAPAIWDSTRGTDATSLANGTKKPGLASPHLSSRRDSTVTATNLLFEMEEREIAATAQRESLEKRLSAQRARAHTHAAYLPLPALVERFELVAAPAGGDDPWGEYLRHGTDTSLRRAMMSTGCLGAYGHV